MDYRKLCGQDLDTIMDAIARENGRASVETASAAPAGSHDGGSIKRDAHLSDVDAYLDRANVGTAIGMRKSPMYAKRGIKRKIARVIELIYLRISELTSRDIRSFAAAVIETFRVFRGRIEELFYNDQLLEDRLNALPDPEARLSALEKDAAAVDAKLDALEARLNAELDTRATRLAAELDTREARLAAELDTREARLAAELDTREARLAAELDALKEQAEERLLAEKSELEQQLRELEDKLGAGLDALEEQTGEQLQAEKSKLEQKLQALEDKLDSELAVKHWSNEAGQPIPPSDAVQVASVLENALFYHDFEEHFRGKAGDIRQRLNAYLPVIREHFGTLQNCRCIDLGCGRGEMLDFFRDNGAAERVGVDLNELQLSLCRERGHEVVQADCLSYLRSCEDASADVISAIQLVEHLSFDVLCAVLGEASRVLKKGGIIILETPNCHNLLTASAWFYLDPSHGRPLHPELLRFLAERSGFVQTQILELNPAIYAQKLQKHDDESDGNVDMLNELLFGPQDYAFVGEKA